MEVAHAGESMIDQDLVAWVSVGLQHVPRSEDVPVIYNMFVNFFIKPWNYFDQLEALHAGADDGSLANDCIPSAPGKASYTWTL
jgi:Cu2+-containing amine oxidase